MAATPQVDLASMTMTMEEYLHTSFRPDCDFVDGVVEERTLGETTHSLLQAELVFWFRSRRREWNVRVMSELRTRVSKTRVRIPDVTVAFDDAAMAEQVRVTAPLIAIEVLSPEDRIPRVVTRLADFWSMGTRHIWLLDPEERVAFTYTDAGLRQVSETRLEVAGTPIYLDLPELFSGLE